MAIDSSRPHDAEAVFRKIAELRRGAMSSDAFWKQYLDGITRLVDGDAAVLLVGVDRDGTLEWGIQLLFPEMTAEAAPPREFLQVLNEHGGRCLAEGKVLQPIKLTAVRRGDAFILGVRLTTAENDGVPRLAMLLLSGCSETEASERLMRLSLVRDVPASYLNANSANGAMRRIEAFSSTMELLTQVNREDRFLAAAMLVCNELAARHRCSRVSLGWRKNNYVRLKAISHMDRFEKKMDIVATVEKVMEECIDQDEEIIFPRPSAASFVSRDHEGFCRSQGASAVCSLPLRDQKDRVQAVITMEWADGVCDDTLARHLRLTADQIAPRLEQLHRADRWFGARWASSTRRVLAKIFGFEHTWTKLLCVAVAVALAFLCTYRTEFRVEAPFVVQSRDVRYVPAPFDGYISGVSAKIGQRISKDDVLVQMDTQDLLLERSKSAAERNRYLREQEKARGENALADMRIAEALAEQQTIKIQELDWRLQQSVLKAPIDGVVIRAGNISGELHEHLNAPLSRGDMLVKIASMADLYLECRIDERDIEHVAKDATGDIAFASQPDWTFSARVLDIDPAAVPSQEGNKFVGECEFIEHPQAWIRPGMTGICKINAGERSLIWIFTHRTVDFLRLFFWW